MEARSHDDVEELKARLATLGERVVENVKLLKHEIQGDLERSAERIGQTVVSTVDEVRTGLEETVDRVKDKVDVVAAVRRRPGTAFAVAAGTGFLLALLGGRRRTALPPAPARVEATQAAATRGAVKGGLVASVLTPLLLDFGRMTAVGFMESLMRRKQTHWT